MVVKKEVFFSYSHHDEKLRDELEKRLITMKRKGLITGWHDRKIGPGKEWAYEIDHHMDTSEVILLLVSPDFMVSDYCYSIEVDKALKRHESGEARVIPIILRPVDWDDTPFEKLQVLPTDGKPVTSWSNLDEAFLDVAKGIRKVVEELTVKPLISSILPSNVISVDKEPARLQIKPIVDLPSKPSNVQNTSMPVKVEHFNQSTEDSHENTISLPALVSWYSPTKG